MEPHNNGDWKSSGEKIGETANDSGSQSRFPVIETFTDGWELPVGLDRTTKGQNQYELASRVQHTCIGQLTSR
jgi:hypothetical protein